MYCLWREAKGNNQVLLIGIRESKKSCQELSPLNAKKFRNCSFHAKIRNNAEQKFLLFTSDLKAVKNNKWHKTTKTLRYLKSLTFFFSIFSRRYSYCFKKYLNNIYVNFLEFIIYIYIQENFRSIFLLNFSFVIKQIILLVLNKKKIFLDNFLL